jgi:hypothetical protein
MAIALRKKGRTYSEILTVIPVAKPQIQRITALRIEGQKRGARRRREIRQKAQAEIYAVSHYIGLRAQNRKNMPRAKELYFPTAIP